ncbi:MAG: LamG-like jellyroll fold domain-containing protein, partial [Rhodopirellula sp. JB055]|uniref:LamG-like jellyroll fold domain-containing protein n=1 Tax=Rhodopirellula sp. JB055 TaxID=3342846 RepID=UPI00370BD244
MQKSDSEDNLMGKREFHFFQLEDRVLLSGEGLEAVDAVVPDAELVESLNADLDAFDAALDDLDADEVTPDGEARKNKDEPDFYDPAEGPIPMDPARPIEVIFIDDGVQDSDTLIQNLRDQSDDSQWLIVRLSNDHSGVDQISNTLATLQGVDAVHLVSHGDGESIQLGSDRLSIDSAPSFAGDIASWGHSLDSRADLLIYGCDLASTVEGQDLIEMLAIVCNCDVAASDDATGHEDLGGDWILEYTVGDVSTEVAFGYAAQASWHSTLDITSNLVVHHEYDTSGSLTEADASGSGNDGSWVNDPAWTSDAAVGEYAMDFSQDGSGANSVVEIADDPSLDFSGDFTVSFWYNADALQANSTRLIGSHDGSDGFSIYTSADGSLNFLLQGSTSSATSWVASGFVADSNWHHVTATRSGNNMRMFVDGNPSGTTSANVGVVDVSGPVTIGGTSVAGNDYEGKLDDVRIYTRAISDNDIDVLIAKGAGIQVDTFNDTVDGTTTDVASLLANQGADGQISLREAILAAQNDSDSGWSIQLSSGTYTLDATGIGNASAATGDFDITDEVIIVGSGAGDTILDASGLGDRVFDVDASGELTLQQLSIVDSTTSNEQGGGVRNAGTFFANDVVFSGHTVSNTDGGAIASSGTMTLDRVSIVGNSADNGAVYITGGTSNLTNVTISGNVAQHDAGGIRMGGGVLNIDHSTIANNTATAGYGGGLRVDSGTVNVSNSIFADNTSNFGGNDVDGTIVSGGYNIIEHNSGFSGTDGTDIVGSDPMLAALSVDATSGQHIHAINSGSIAYNAAIGSSTTDDQRGVARDASADIGAYEYIRPPQLLARYDFDSGSAATDSSGNGLDGTLQGDASVDTTTNTNQVGDGKLTLDGSGDYVDLSANASTFSTLSEGTVATWVKFSTTGFATIFDVSSGDPNEFASLWVENGNVVWAVTTGGTPQLRMTSIATIHDNQWHHVAVTSDASGNTLYIDGVAQTGGDITYSYGDATTDIFFDDLTGVTSTKIGAYDIGTVGGEFNGQIDDTRIYNYAVTDAEMADLYALQAGLPSDLSTTATSNGGVSINADGGNDAYFIAENGGAVLGGLSSTTVEIQFSSDSVPSQTTLFSYEGDTDSNALLAIVSGTTLKLYINGTDYSFSGYDFTSLGDGFEHSVAITWDGPTGAASLYVDGEVVSSITGVATGQTLAADGTLVFGQEQDGVDSGYTTPQIFSGTLHDIRIFDDARTASEIESSYRGDLPRTESGLLANWQFNQLSTDGVVIEAVSGNNLTLKHVDDVSFTASNSALTFAVNENAITGSIVGSVSGQDAERDAQIAALLAADSELTYNAATGKFYKTVLSSGTWTAAHSAAESTTLSGLTGDLVTIDSSSENAFVQQLATDYIGNDVWIGATDASVEGEWRWQDEDVNTSAFWQGDENGYAVDGNYQNWHATAGPTGGASEDYALLQQYDGTWFDATAVQAMDGYVVQWDADLVLDATDALTYSIESQTVAGAFAIDASTGVITVADGSLLDYESQASHALTVRVTDEDSNTYNEVFTVSLNDLVESDNAPSDLSSGIELNTDGGNDAYLFTNVDLLSGLSSVTVETLFSIDHTNGQSHRLFDFTATGGSENELSMMVRSDGTIDLGIHAYEESTTEQYSELLDGHVHHVAISWDSNGGNWSLYIDGEHAESGDGLGDGLSFSVSDGLSIGQSFDDGADAVDGEQFHGTVYDFRLWEEVRTEPEIASNHQQKLDSDNLPDGLIASWQMDGFSESNEVVDVVSGNNLSVGHATGFGFTTSTPVEDLHIDENAGTGTSVGYVVPSAPDTINDVVDDGLFLEADDPGTYTRYTNATPLGAWTVENGNVDLLGSVLPDSENGGRAVELNGDTTGVITQSLTTVAGQQYQLTFEAGGNFSGGQDHVEFRASADGISQDITIAQPDGWSFSNNQSNYYTLTFTATSDTSILRFESLETGPYGAVVAEIQVTETPAAISTILHNDPSLTYDSVTNKFYRYVDADTDWNSALALATGSSLNGADGQLVTIRSQYEQDLIAQMATDANDYLWLGASDALVEGEYRWYDGTEAGDQFWQGDHSTGTATNNEYNNWSSNEPNNIAAHDYAFLWHVDGTWGDTDASPGTPDVVVEWDATEVVSNFTFSLTDPSNNFEIDSNTGEITVATSHTLDYEISESHQVAVTVTDAAGLSHNQFITINVNDGKDVFHDLSDGNDDGQISGTQGGNVIYGGPSDGSADGGAVTDDNIQAGRGDDTIYGGDGNDNIDGDDTTVADMLTADPSLVYNESTGKFYKLISGTTDWDSAKEAAESTSVLGYSARLVQIGTAAENAFVQSLAGGSAVWLGASDTGHQDAFVWTDGTPISYQNFSNGDPNGAQLEDALIMNADGTWSDASEILSYAYVIEIFPENSDDTITGGGGDDLIEGGVGIDVAVYTGAAADYTITDNMDGTWTITDNVALRDGTDTLSGIEQLRFSDATYETAQAGFNSAPTDIELVTPGDDLIAQPIENLQSYTGYSNIYSSVVAKADGGYVLLYTNYDNDSGWDIMAQHYDENGDAVGEADVMTRQILSYSDYSFDVATLNDGTHIVTWYDSAYEVRAQHFDADFNEIGNFFTVNTTTAHYQYYPDVAATGDGGFVIAWRSLVDEDSNSYADYSDVFAQKFDSSGVAVGAEIHVTQQTLNQYETAVAGFGDGSFMVTWRSDNSADDGNGSAVMGRFYDANGVASGAEFIVNTTTSGT